MNPQSPKKRNYWIIYGVIMALLLIFNMSIARMFSTQQVEEVKYSEFLMMLEGGVIDTVDVEDTVINYTATIGGRRGVYKTGRMNDPLIVERLIEAKVEFSTEIPTTVSPLVTMLINFVLPMALTLGIGLLLMRMLTKRMGGDNVMSFGKSNAKVYVAAQTGKTFADVAGEEEAKAALVEIVDFLHDPGKYKEIGAKLPKGALLVGPPGTGKTLLAQAVAGEANVPFFSISGSEFVEMFVGMGAARVRDLFKQAQEKAPCIVFIDEIDAVGKKRDGTIIGGNDEREQTLNQLLTEMDGFDGSKGVVILAATNRPESLDNALLRPGRFDRRIPVELPDLAGREAILRVHAKEVKMEPNVDWRAVALATSGTSGAELANIINEGALLAVKEHRTRVSQKDLEEAIETVMAGYQRKNAVISPEEKKVVSYHEIGHALVAARQKSSAPVHKITIIPRTSGALGYTMQVDEDEHYLMTREEIQNKIVTLTAGRAAEELIFNQITSGAANDIEQATKLARTMITRLGMSDTFGMTALATLQNPYLSNDASLACSDATAARVDAEVMQVIRTAHARASQILKENEDKLHELAAYLLERETITGEEFMGILTRGEEKAPVKEPVTLTKAEDKPDISVPTAETAEEKSPLPDAPAEEGTEG
ncbi:MAG: ATP-dependent zinc metalloprotease FtsH [Clostridia bacterium]|nr:ATP-dependent zinc metalloprotease FtsH [Clostridia bacterium]